MENVNYSLNPDTHEITEEELGSFLQYPLRLAWAITIHKSQGLTFDKLIIDAENAFANGQVYVALSRCTSLEGLILTSHVNRKFLGAHQNLKDWQEKNHDEKNLQQKFHDSRQKYIQQELQNIFTWKNWHYELRELNDILDEQKENLPAECFSWIAELAEKQKTLQDVADKFKERIIQLCNPVAQISNLCYAEENQPLQKRIKDAANYFSAEIMKWKEKFFNHPLSTDTKKTARKMDVSLNEINFIVHEILHKINHCKNGFLLNDYLKNGKKVVPIYRDEKIQSSYAQNQIRNISSKELEHSGLYDSIAEMRRRIGSATNLPLYTIFNNNAIKNVCMSLPGSKDALLKVRRIRQSKSEKYGDEVLGLVREYCLENNLEPQQILKNPDKSGRERKSQPQWKKP